MKVTVETALNAELDDHLGYDKHNKSNHNHNSRNGYSSKRPKTEDGEIDLETHHDRGGSFEPRLVKKHQAGFQSMANKIISLYVKGVITCEIVDTFQ